MWRSISGCTADGVGEEELLGLAYALEKKSEHPLARAILSLAEERKLRVGDVSGFKALPGNGLEGELDGALLRGGNRSFISSHTTISPSIVSQSEGLADEGKTPLFFSRDGQLAGVIAVADVIKEDSPQAVKELQNMGIHVVMLTGGSWL